MPPKFSIISCECLSLSYVVLGVSFAAMAAISTSASVVLSDPLRKIFVGAGVCATTCGCAITAYTSAGWSFIDSVYMVVITLFGIGYGEVRPLDNSFLKLQTIVLIVLGCSSGVYSLGGFVQLVAEGELTRVFGAHKMSRGLKKMKDHAIICGFGRVGKMLAADLSSKQTPFLIIDSNPARLAEAEEAGFAVVSGDASSDETLERAGIQRARYLASVLPNDAVNVFITLTARDLNANLEIIARAECPTTERKLLRSGADHVVMPAAIGALRMAQIIDDRNQERTPPSISSPNPQSLTAVPVANRKDLEDITLELASLALSDVGAVIGLQRGDRQRMTTDIHQHTILKKSDILLLSTEP